MADKRYKIYFLLDVYACTSCGQMVKDINRYPALGNTGSFLFSSDEVTQEQADDFLSETFGKPVNAVVNKSLFNKVAGSQQRFKIPKLAIYDSISQRTIHLMQIDSIYYNIDLINLYLNSGGSYKHTTYSNPRIRRLIGQKNINKVGDKLFISAYQNTDRIYIFDLATEKLDSIFISDETLKKLYEAGGIVNPDISKLRAYHKQNNLSMPLIQFHSMPYSDDKQFTDYLNVWYYDPDYTGDTIDPKGISFFVNYNVEKRQLKIQEFDYWESNPPTGKFYQQYIPSKYAQEFTYKRMINDTTWIVSGDKQPDQGKENSKTIMLLKFTKAGKKWQYSGHKDSLYVEQINDFKGENLNDPTKGYIYQYKQPYLFFGVSPIIKDFSNGKTIDLSTVDKKINWVFDLEYTANLVNVLVQKPEDGIYLLAFDRGSLKLLSQELVYKKKAASTSGNENAELEDFSYQSNTVLKDGKMYFVSKKGEIVQLEK